MAIPFVCIEYVKRSAGKTICLKSAYIGRMRIEFEGNKVLQADIYDWSHREKPLYHAILLPDHADKSFLDPQKLWNAVEKFETRKDAQVGIDVVLALPDDAVIISRTTNPNSHKLCPKTLCLKRLWSSNRRPSTQYKNTIRQDDGKLIHYRKKTTMSISLPTPRHFTEDGLTFSRIKSQ